MSGPLKFSGSSIELNGDIFTGQAAVKIKNNVGREVGNLTELGRRLVVGQLGARPVPPRTQYASRRRTGFTERSIEAYHKPENSLYGRVQVKAKLERPAAKSSRGVQAKRLPYVIVAVLESGRQGGAHIQRVSVNLSTGRVRARRKWQAGRRTRKPVWAFRSAARVLKTKADTIRDSLVTRGLT